MSIIKRWLSRLRRRRIAGSNWTESGLEQSYFEALIRAQGDWLALLATILERERIITTSELARSLAEFAALTAEERSTEGRILSVWASRLHDTAAVVRDLPSVH